MQNEKDEVDMTFRLILIGESGVGKSNILNGTSKTNSMRTATQQWESTPAPKTSKSAVN